MEPGLWLDSNGGQRNNVLSAGFNVHSNNADPSVRPFRVIEGTVEYSAKTEDYRAYITMLHQWWEEGLIYQDFLAPAECVVARQRLGAEQCHWCLGQ